ncbi:MAG: hypothetical protein HYV02_02430 [Deltaproteobacteria bacterium]|nr:hypothetical protein [Deltaproteobacteria bacterium]
MSNHYRERAVAYLIARHHDATIGGAHVAPSSGKAAGASPSAPQCGWAVGPRTDVRGPTNGTASCASSVVPAYGPASSEAEIRRRLEACVGVAPDELAGTIAEGLAGLQAAEEVVILNDIHPAWLVELLATESPRVIGLLLRFLPSRHARYLLDHLPPHIRERLPHIVDAFAVSETIVRIVRRRFESHFLPIAPTEELAEFDCRALHRLTLDDITTLLYDLGVHELAMAFRHIAQPALRLLLNRLSFHDAQRLVQRIASLGRIDPTLERDARYTILNMSLEGSDPETLIREIGVQAFVKALLPQHLPMVYALRQKLPPVLAYLLQRDTDMHLPNNQPVLAALRQHQILLRVASLSRDERIDVRWWRALPEVLRGDPALIEEGTQRIPVEHDDADAAERAQVVN